MKPRLLSREQFRESVIARDNHKCVFCDHTEELFAHHIIERRLFTGDSEFGGYFLDNGATVCDKHHRECESTAISAEDVREACGIMTIILPNNFYDDAAYDKWGNVMLPTGMRLVGPLFYDESVQKVLTIGGVLDLFSRYVKYPRTNHAPWSDGMTTDDRRIDNLDAFIGQEVVVTRKIDGEQSTIYNDYFHARSIDGPGHESRNYVKSLAAKWQHALADDERVNAENAYARHSIAYHDLPSPLLGFAMWRRNICLSWDETIENFSILGIEPVPVLWRGTFDEVTIRGLYNTERDWDTHEGYVVRRASEFSYADFRSHVMKFVRAGHVATAVHHWRSQRVIPNGFLKD